MKPFIYSAHPSRVVFGHGTISQIKSEIDRLGCSRALVLTTPFQKDLGIKVQAELGETAVGLYTNATMHTPTNVTEEAVALAESVKADCVVSLGGGSTVGLGKAIALRTDLPQIVLPTTYAGSEATPIIGQTEDGAKTTQVTLKVLPEVIIYDVDLTLTLPLGMTITSGINAVAHSVEALYSKDANPITDSLALQGIAAIVNALPKLKTDLTDKDARSDALFGAWACGTCLGQSTMSIHHKLCHLLGGTFNMPHAETHTVILPHAIAYNTPFAKEAIAKLAPLFPGEKDVATALWKFQKDLGAPTTLKELGFKEENLKKAASLAESRPYPNPAPLDEEKLLLLLSNAFHGNPPTTLL